MPAEIQRLRRQLALCQDELDLRSRVIEESGHDLEISRQRYADLYDLAPIGYATLDLKGLICEINLAGAALLGWERKHFLGKPLLPMVVRPDRRRLGQHLSRCSKEPGEASTELMLMCRGGRQVAVQMTSKRVVGLDGKSRLLTVLADITDRKRAEEAGRRRQGWDQTLVTIGQMATTHHSLQRILASGLEAIMRTSGASLSILRLVDPMTQELVIAAHQGLAPAYLQRVDRLPWGEKLAGRVAESGEPMIIGRLQEQPEVSRLALLPELVQSVLCLPLKAENRVVGTLTLGTRQVEFFATEDLAIVQHAAAMLAGAILAEQLRTATQREAEEKDLLLRELDHRVRNNLAALISLLHMGAETSEGPAASILVETANRVARLADVHNLLAGRGVQPIDLRELAEAVAKNVLTLSETVQIQWSITGHSVRVPRRHITALALVLNELLTNCTKHAFRGRASGSVSIRVLKDGEATGLEVWDDGVGLPGAGPAAGLGLTIVETLVTHTLQGSLWFAAARDGGTVVYIRVPREVEMAVGDAS